MAAQIIDGKEIAATLRKGIAVLAGELERTHGVRPGLAVVLAGSDPASQVYVRNKGKAAEEAGFHSEQIDLPGTVTQEELLKVVDSLNARPDIHGILVQLPLPKQVDERAVLLRIDPRKDVDGFHPMNVGALASGLEGFRPCTPSGCLDLIRSTGIRIEGEEAVVIGRSNIVGKPVALMLLEQNATVTICHSRTRNLPESVRRAGLVVAAIGRAEFVKGDWIREGAVVIDVGINRLPGGKLVGDVEFGVASQRAGFITPVPGGVGPMTIAKLMENTLIAAERTVGRNR